jgi:hypothetical protein
MMTDERAALDQKTIEATGQRVEGVTVKTVTDTDMEVYPFARWQDVVTYWQEPGEVMRNTGDWVFGPDIWPNADEQHEIEAKHGARRVLMGTEAYRLLGMNWRDYLVKREGYGIPPEDYIVRTWCDRAKSGISYHQEQGEQGRAWKAAKDELWKLAERKLHDYIRRGVPCDRVMELYREAEKTIIPEMRDKLNEIPEARFQVRISDDGEDVELDRYINAEPELWIRPERMKARKRSVTLGVNMVANEGRDADYFAKVFVGLTVIANYLVKHGYEVRLLGVRLPVFRFSEYSDEGSWKKSRDFAPFIRGYVFPLVNFGERFDPIRLLTWATPGVVRYFGFGWVREIFGNESDLQGEFVAYRMGAGQEAQLTAESAKLVGVDWLVTPSGADVAGSLITQAGEVFGNLWQ